jgi:fibronectin-binding autotransporter adhesin
MLIRTAPLFLLIALAAAPLQPPAAQAQTINLTATDAGGVSSFNSGANWAGGLAPSPGNNYSTNGFTLRTPDTTNNFTFQGDSLTLTSGTGLASKTTGTITIPNLFLAGGQIAHFQSPGANTTTLAGNFVLQQSTTINTNAAGREFIISATIAGTNPAAQLTFTSTGGFSTLSGNNTFQGTVLVDTAATTAFTRLHLTSSQALGNASMVTVQNTGGPTGFGSDGVGNRITLANNITIDRALTLLSSADRRVALVNTGGNNIWSGNVTLDGPAGAQLYSQAGNLSITGDITAAPTMGGLLGLRGNAGATGTLSGTINLGAQGIVVTDSAAWTIASTGNTWSTTRVASGTLRLGAANAIPTTSPITMGQTSTTVGTLDLNGFNQIVPSITTDTGNPSNQVITNTSATPATLTINGGASTTYAGRLNGNLNVVKDGLGVLTLSGNSNTTGSFLVDNTTGGGTAQLTLASNNALGNASMITVQNTSGAASGTGSRLNLQGNITVNNDLTLRSSGGNQRTALVNNSGNNVWAGDIYLDGSALNQFQIVSGTLTITGDVIAQPTLTQLLFLRGASTGTISGNINLGTNHLAKTDDGTWVIASSGNTWNQTQIARGTIRLGADDALPTTTFLRLGQGTDGSAAVLDLNGFDQTISNLDAFFTGGNNKRITNLNAGQTSNFTYIRNVDSTLQSGIFVNGNLNFIKDGSGELTIRGNNLGYTGETIVRGGTLFLGGGAAPSIDTQLPNGTVVTVASGATLRINGLGGSATNNEIIGGLQGGGTIDTSNAGTIARLTINNTDDFNFSGSINANDRLQIIKQGNGIQTLSGTSTFAGDTTVEGGTLNVTGTVSRPGGSNPITILSDGRLSGSGTINGNVTVTGGTLAPGNAASLLGLGTLTLNGDLTFASTWEVNIDGTTASLLDHTGSSLDLSNITLAAGTNSFSSEPFTPYLIYSGSNPTTGQFANLLDASSFSVFPDAALPFPGTATPDGYVILGGTPFAAYLNVDFAGGSLSGNDIVLFSIPEPSRIALLALSILPLLFHRRRPRS